MYFATWFCVRPIRPQLRDPLLERLRREPLRDELLPDDERRRRLVVEELDELRLRDDPPSPSSSSSSPNRASFAPRRAPLVLLAAPSPVMSSISSGSPCVSVCIRSRRLTASANRR